MRTHSLFGLTSLPRTSTAGFLIFALMLVSTTLYAATTLRVGNKVLSVGDSAVRVQQVMGNPAVRAFTSPQTGRMPTNQLAAGEQWQYAQDGKTIVITIIGGRVSNIETLYE
ncbi:DUF2845 domain-containing protein [Dyella monticola]|uniref:DUF2845 domain-containing protein n=1 Tax=Dyella monticola TaxID=1927958 RepID=A0A370WUN7_9GAMM|nr:DUF2845 domain-containing protein [Dyella monticola]RDS79727.1 DUF2845 domain-containing protein [Dyella monticola]